MTIHSPDIYAANIWDWGFLDECFSPSKIKITDIDGLIERNGHFLLIETKMPDIEIPKGQSILFDALLKTRCFHVLIIWGYRNKPEHRMFWGYSRKVPATEQSIKEIVKRWYTIANRN